MGFPYEPFQRPNLQRWPDPQPFPGTHVARFLWVEAPTSAEMVCRVWARDVDTRQAVPVELTAHDLRQLRHHLGDVIHALEEWARDTRHHQTPNPVEAAAAAEGA